MYSDKENINILVNLLLDSGIDEAVVCPGSRNAPIVRNLCHAGFKCHAVTDERSAGFYALGIALALNRPVCVCVTSASAVLNLVPAVCEAWHRHVPLIVITADRPAMHINQLMGQTIEQPGAFSPWVKKCVSLPEPHDRSTSAYCNRLVNEALLACNGPCKAPVHINVPLSEPLFGENSKATPQRIIRNLQPTSTLSTNTVKKIQSRLSEAKRPMIIIGQCLASDILTQAIKKLEENITVIYEPLCCNTGGVPFDEVLAKVKGDNRYVPDFVLYAGDTLVSKRIKILFDTDDVAETWELTSDGDVHDVLGNVSAIVQCDAVQALQAIANDNDGIDVSSEAADLFNLWNEALNTAKVRITEFKPRYSQMLAVRCLEELITSSRMTYNVHYANSSAVRLANIYARHYVWVNRGVNGIEGSLSTAAGFSLANPDPTICVIGDLSFFYDNNALWNCEISGNLRILLLNNHGGAIFNNVKGMPNDNLSQQYVMATHQANAKGICEAYGIEHLRAENADELSEALPWLIDTSRHERPLLLEVITDADTDAQQMNEYINFQINS